MFHVYALLWTSSEVIWYLDGNELRRCTFTETNPSDALEWLFFYLAVGGGFPGAPDATTQWPIYYKMDYVRVYQDPSGTISLNGTKNPIAR